MSTSGHNAFCAIFPPASGQGSGGARALKLGGTVSCRRREVSRGVRGHASPGKFCNRESLKRNFLGFPGNFEVNSQDFEAT